MAQGDAFSVHGSDNTILLVQPAVGVVYMVTTVSMDQVEQSPRLYNGSEESQIANKFDGTVVNTGYNFSNMKVFITNSNYLKINALGAGNSSSVTGIIYSE